MLPHVDSGDVRARACKAPLARRRDRAHARRQGPRSQAVRRREGKSSLTRPLRAH